MGRPANGDRRSRRGQQGQGREAQADSRTSFASGGVSGSRMDRECKSGHCQRLAEVEVHPLAIGQDMPSRLGPASEGRSDSGVLHLHPRGQVRYPEGGRRREDEPQEGVRVRANAGDDEHEGDDHTRGRPAGAVPLMCH